MKKNPGQKYINTIMNNRYGNDDPKYDGQNLAFLETLSLDELARLANDNDFDDDEFEDEFEFKGKVTKIDFDDDELNWEW